MCVSSCPPSLSLSSCILFLFTFLPWVSVYAAYGLALFSLISLSVILDLFILFCFFFNFLCPDCFLGFIQYLYLSLVKTQILHPVTIMVSSWIFSNVPCHIHPRQTQIDDKRKQVELKTKLLRKDAHFGCIKCELKRRKKQNSEQYGIWKANV